MGKTPRLFIILLYILLTYCNSYSQPLTKKWDKTYGGSGMDITYDLIQTCDAGFLIGGYTFSDVSGLVTSPNRGEGSEDYWVVKTDSLGNVMWDKRFGGDGYDNFHCISNSTDGGYLLGGSTTSTVSGDKTQPRWDSTDYTGDVWVVKIDDSGNIQWDKRYGGKGVDVIMDIEPTNDGGFILACPSRSNISGNKSQNNYDITEATYDYWIIKIDRNGEIQWEKTIGGDKSDWPESVKKTSDGGYIVGGVSRSGISGDKTQDNWDTSQMTPDYWIVKIDKNGNKIWDKTYGGNWNEFYGKTVEIDNYYFVAGLTDSPISGDRTSPKHGANYYQDCWVVKLDLNGNKIWDKIYGGNAPEDGMCNIIGTKDNNFIITCSSWSGISGEKSQSSNGDQLPWVIKIDLDGTKIWDKTILLSQSWNGYAEPTIGTIQTSDGCYVTGCFTDAGIGQDKTEACYGNYDYFIMKFCDESQTNEAYIPPCNILPEDSTKGTVQQNIFIPDIFSPNGDGNNDKFFVRGNNIKEVYFAIYDRWGEKIFETTDKNTGWDGTYKGNRLSTAVFVYYCYGKYSDGTDFKQKGDVTLVR